MTRGRGALAVVAGVLAFLLALAWSQESSRDDAVAGRRAELLQLLGARQARTARLERDLAELERRLDRLTAGVGGPAAARLDAGLRRLGPLAGTAAVSGPGVVVELADSPLAAIGDRSDADFLIQDVDLQAVVNALWAAGAEAISINGQRVISTTAIRGAGSAILVNYRVLLSPYRVSAVGDPRAMREAFGRSPIARRFAGWADVYRLGFRVRVDEEIRVPAFAGSVRFRYASPVG